MRDVGLACMFRCIVEEILMCRVQIFANAALMVRVSFQRVRSRYELWGLLKQSVYCRLN